MLLAALAARIHARGRRDHRRDGTRRARRRRPRRRRRRRARSPWRWSARISPACRSTRELTRRGATFVRAAATAPEYRLYALPGGPPQRPGLVRVNDGGCSIAVEVWALDPAAFGDFVAAIPAPLGIGTLRLADGTSVQGFLCEAAALDGARDITGFGGWRAYVASLG